MKDQADMRDVMHNQNLLLALGRGPTSFPLTVRAIVIQCVH